MSLESGGEKSCIYLPQRTGGRGVFAEMFNCKDARKETPGEPFAIDFSRSEHSGAADAAPLRVFSLRALREIPLCNLSTRLCERLFSLRS